MKKIISFILAVVILCGMIPTALATTSSDEGTIVKYVGTKSNEYFITVPAKLMPSGQGNVKAEGYWPSNMTLVVKADEQVVLTNDINANDTKSLKINFEPIQQSGSNVGKVEVTKVISVDAIENALFGTWSGKFYYNVELKSKMVAGVDVKSSLEEYTWTEIQQLSQAKLDDYSAYNIEIGDTKEGYLLADFDYMDGFAFIGDTKSSYTMDGNGNNKNGYIDMRMKSTAESCYTAIKNTELGQAMKEVTVKACGGRLSTTKVHEMQLHMFLPSVVEVGLQDSLDDSLAAKQYILQEGRTLEYFKEDGGNKFADIYNRRCPAWLRTAVSGSFGNFYTVSAGGALNSDNAQYSKAMVLMFII